MREFMPTLRRTSNAAERSSMCERGFLISRTYGRRVPANRCHPSAISKKKAVIVSRHAGWAALMRRATAGHEDPLSKTWLTESCHAAQTLDGPERYRAEVRTLCLSLVPRERRAPQRMIVTLVYMRFAIPSPAERLSVQAKLLTASLLA